MPKILFQSSMPRSGSTVLQNVLGQNPDFYVSPTSGLIELIYAARRAYSSVPEFKSEGLEKNRDAFAAFCNEGIHAYAAAMTNKPFYIDKGRSWGYYITWLEHFMPYQPKIICMVRDLRDIFCSMEKLFRRNPDIENEYIDWRSLTNVTVAKRIDTFASGIPIGIAVERLESVLQQHLAHKFLFVKYEDFCLRPEAEMSRIYNYLELPLYNHNFDNIEQLTQEDDTIQSMSDHIIRPSLEMKTSDANNILGPSVCDWIYNRYKWYFDYFNYSK